MANTKYSYVKVEYGRNVGKCQVTRFLRVDLLGSISYVEKREYADHTMWKMGMISHLNVLRNSMKASTQKEYDKNYSIALKLINNE